MRIKVYEGVCGNYFITDKCVEGIEPDAEFESVPDAEDAIVAVDGWAYLDRDLINESGYSYAGEDYELHSFDFAEEFAA